MDHNFNLPTYNESYLQIKFCNPSPYNKYRQSQLIIRIVLCHVFVVGILGNSCGYLLIKRIPRPSLYYRALKKVAMFNLIICVVGAFNVANIIKNMAYTIYWPNNFWNYIYKYSMVIINGLCGASLYTLCLGLWDRYKRLQRPFLYVERHPRNERYLNFLPYVFMLTLLLVNISCYNWYYIMDCIFIDSAQAYANVDGHPKPNWRYRVTNFANGTRLYYTKPKYDDSKYYDILRAMITSVIPGFIILYLGCGITYMLIKYLKRHLNSVGNLPCTMTSTFNQGDTHRGIRPNTIINLAINNVTSTHRPSLWSLIYYASATNISAILCFVLYCSFEIPNIVVTMFRYTNISKRIIHESDMLEIMFFALTLCIFIISDTNCLKQINSLKSYWLTLLGSKRVAVPQHFPCTTHV